MGRWDRPSNEKERRSSEDVAFTVLELSSETPMLDLHGETKDEAALKVDGFIREQFALGIDGVKIMHGKGTGALEKMLKKTLGAYPFVKAVRPSTKPEEQGAVLLVLFCLGADS